MSTPPFIHSSFWRLLFGLGILIVLIVLIGFAVSTNIQLNPAVRNSPVAASVTTAPVAITAPHGTIHALVADTPASREQGLSGHDPLPASQGMLFVFSDSEAYAFWMKDMKFALDMVWIDEAKNVVGVTRNISPVTYPDTFIPPSPARYVLELDANQAASFGIATGTVLSF